MDCHLAICQTNFVLDLLSAIDKQDTGTPGGRGQLRHFAIRLLVRMMQAIVTSLPVKPGKFEWLTNYNLTKFFILNDQSSYSTPGHQRIKPT